MRTIVLLFLLAVGCNGGTMVDDDLGGDDDDTTASDDDSADDDDTAPPAPVGEIDLADAEAILEGEAAGDHAGQRTAGGFDLDGDGFGDIAVGAPKHDVNGSDCGAVYLIPGPVSGTHSLGDIGYKLVGEMAEQEAGRSINGSGDVNGDGLHDLVLGAPQSSIHGQSSGAAYLVLGTASPASMTLSDADARLEGEAAGDSAGWTVTIAGDVNGDGLDDVLVGAVGEDTGGTDAGAAYLVYGPIEGNVHLSQADVKLVGEEEGDWLGRSVGYGGDVDGDGFADLLVGACYQAEGAEEAGATYLLYGPFPDGVLDLSAADAKLLGEQEGAIAGRTLEGGGDLNGDGLLDLVIGAPLWDSELGMRDGVSYVVHGQVWGTHALVDADARIVGEEPETLSGAWVAIAGDVDADGYDDALFGAPAESTNGFEAGATYLYYGPVVGDLDHTAADAKLLGQDAEAQAGRGLSRGGDVNADGYADILIGAFHANNAGPHAGAAYLVLGGER